MSYAQVIGAAESTATKTDIFEVGRKGTSGKLAKYEQDLSGPRTREKRRCAANTLLCGCTSSPGSRKVSVVTNAVCIPLVLIFCVGPELSTGRVIRGVTLNADLLSELPHKE